MTKQLSKIDELISKLCPDGVGFKLLYEVATIKHGKDYKSLGSGDVPVYGSGGIMTYVDTYSYNKPSVLIPRKGTITNLFFVETPFWNVDTIFYTVIKAEQVIPKFLYFYLKTVDLAALDTGSGRPSLTIQILNKLKIPIPPIAIQEEIVKILDSFTELERELERELEARKKQYEYYQKKILFPNAGVTFRRLSEIARITIGEFVHKNKQNSNGQFPVFNGGTTETGYYDEFNNTGNKIIISARGANAGFINKIFRPYWAGNSCYSVEILDKNIINWIYLFYYLKSNQNKLIGEQQRGGIPAVSKKQVENFEIPMLNLPEQNRIVAILDKFDALVNDISIGLPAELKARRQQYEYYRNTLLTFEELKTNSAEVVRFPSH